MAVPRIGHEVIVDFLEGDPDQPIITGRTYHAVNVPPYQLPANKTRMTIKSKTHQGEGYNELRFEDENNKQQIYLHSEKDQDIIIENDRMEWIRHDRHLRVDNDKYEQVAQDSHQTIGQDKQDRIERHRHLYAGGNFIWRIIGQVHRWIGGGLQLFVGASRSTEIGANDDLVIGADQRTAVGNQSYTRARNIVLEANQALTIKAPGGFIKIDAGGIAIKGNIVKLNSGGSPDAGTAPKPPQPDTPQTPSQPKDADARNEH
jgi:type VI secretion system secreted protein VgrG